MLVARRLTGTCFTKCGRSRTLSPEASWEWSMGNCSGHPRLPAGSRKRQDSREGSSEQSCRHSTRLMANGVQCRLCPRNGPGQLFLSRLQILAGDFLETIVMFRPVPLRASWNPLDHKEQRHYTTIARSLVKIVCVRVGGRWGCFFNLLIKIKSF